jgi:hypothetical protein
MKICLMDSNSYPVGQPREAEPFGLVDCKPHDAGKLAEINQNILAHLYYQVLRLHRSVRNTDVTAGYGIARTQNKDGLMRAYEISRRRKGKSTKETEQSTEEGEGDGYKHCERCTGCITLVPVFSE